MARLRNDLVGGKKQVKIKIGNAILEGTPEELKETIAQLGQKPPKIKKIADDLIPPSSDKTLHKYETSKGNINYVVDHNGHTAIWESRTSKYFYIDELLGTLRTILVKEKSVELDELRLRFRTTAPLLSYMASLGEIQIILTKKGKKIVRWIK